MAPATCARCSRPLPCGCPAARKLYPETLKLRREKRGGREVIVIDGFNPGTQIDLAALARDLRRLCGTGGTVKGRSIEIQGDHRDRLQAELLTRGFRSKQAGG